MARSGQVRISHVLFQNFKALDQFALSMDDVNILVGPNNSGKSTIIESLQSARHRDQISTIASPKPHLYRGSLPAWILDFGEDLADLIRECAY